MTTRKRPLPRGIREVTLPSGQTRFVVTVDTAAPGQPRRQVKRTVTTVTEARKALDTLRGQVAVGTFVQADPQTVGARLDSWLTVKRHEVRPTTHEGYRNAAKPWREAFGGTRVQALTRDDVQAAVDTMREAGRTGRTIHLSLIVLRSALALAVRDGLVTRNVADQVKAPRHVPPEKRAFTPEQAGAFLASVTGTRMEAAFRLSLLGLRRGEVLGLRWSDVDTDAPSLSVRQSRTAVTSRVTHTDEPKVPRSRRTLPLGGLPEVVAALRAYRKTRMAECLALGVPWEADGLLVCDEAGVALRPERYSDLWREACVAAGVPGLTLHEARHTAASLLAEAGVPPEVAAAWLGHDPAMYLRTYVHPRAERVAAAGEALAAAFGG